MGEKRHTRSARYFLFQSCHRRGRILDGLRGNAIARVSGANAKLESTVQDIKAGFVQATAELAEGARF